MSFSLQPDQIIGIADRLRRALDETLDRSDTFRAAVEALSAALSRVSPARTAFDDVADARVALSRGMVSHGRVAVAALRTTVLSYVTADEEMAETAAELDARTRAPLFDPSRFGPRLS